MIGPHAKVPVGGTPQSVTGVVSGRCASMGCTSANGVHRSVAARQIPSMHAKPEPNEQHMVAPASAHGLPLAPPGRLQTDASTAMSQDALLTDSSLVERSESSAA